MFNCIRTDYNEDQILITIMFTDYCNFHCNYCIENLASITHFNVDIEKVIQLLDYIHQLYFSKTINIEVYGGEPTLHPRLIDFCKIIRSTKLYVNEIDLYTNFSNTIDYYKKLQELQCHLSLTYHYSFCNKDVFFQKLSKLELVENKVSVNVMYENDNIDKILEVYNVLRQKDVKLELGLVFSTDKFISMYTKKQYLKFDFLNSLYNEKFYYKINDKQVKVNISDSLNFYNCKCSAGMNSLFISPDNKVYPCNIYYRERNKFIKGISIDQILNDKNFKLNFTTCMCKTCLPCIPIKVLDLPSDNIINKNLLFQIQE